MANAMELGGRNHALRQWVACALLMASAPLTLHCAAQNPAGDEAMAQGNELPANAIWLDALNMKNIEQEYGKAQSKMSVDANPLMLNGKTYPHGIGTHARSEINIDLKGVATRFIAMAGVDDEKEGKGSVEFLVRLDGKTVARSGILKGKQAPHLFSVDLTGAKKLTLRVTDGDDGIDSDHADWGGAMLQLLPNAAQQPQMLKSFLFDAPPPPIAMSLPAAPMIHGARITGATPGHPFLFKVPATGLGTLQYSAKNLPAGLTIEPKTGIISGSLEKDGVTVVTLSVQGERGNTSRKLTIVGGKDKLALTPPMGWNSWNIYYCGVDEKKVREAADWLVKTGLINHGYQYVNIDDCWQAARLADGEIGVNEKFGDMKVLGDRLHEMGFKFGVYSSPGPKTCAGYDGSWQHEAQDVATYAKWGVDYLKYDWCSYGGIAKGQDLPELEKQQLPYRLMGDLLSNAPRDIVFSLCQYGMAEVPKWGDEVHGNLWRTTGDIGPSYGSMANIGFGQIWQGEFAKPGHWNDPDMLFMHALQPTEQITHLSLWSLLAAPLLIGSDLSKVTPFTINALSNDEVIDVDQDPLGIQGHRVSKDDTREVWMRPLWDGTMAVGLFNRDTEAQKVTVTWSDLKLQGAQPVRDLWQQKELGKVSDAFTAEVPPHGAILVKIGQPKNVDAYVPTVK